MSDIDEYYEPDMDYLVLECPCGNTYHKGEGFLVDGEEACSYCASDAKYCEQCEEYITKAIEVEDVYVCDEECKRAYKTKPKFLGDYNVE